MTEHNDPFDLTRFVQAQEPIYAQALAEIKAGQKRTHWMWFIFPRHADRDDRHGVAIAASSPAVIPARSALESGGLGGSHWRGCLGRSAG